MASGYVTGYQHELIDMKDFNKETFIEFCDKYFYHLKYYEITKEEFDQRKKDQINDTMESLKKAQAELEEIENRTDDEWQALYNMYVAKTEEDNRKWLAAYDIEIARFRLIEEYASHMKPHLDYIWKELKEPKLYHSDTMSFEDWKEGKIYSGKHYVEFYMKRVNDINAEKHQEEDEKVTAYEQAKKKFLEG